MAKVVTRRSLDKHKYYVVAYHTKSDVEAGEPNIVDKNKMNWEEAQQVQDALLDTNDYNQVNICAFKDDRVVSYGSGGVNKYKRGANIKSHKEVHLAKGLRLAHGYKTVRAKKISHGEGKDVFTDTGTRLKGGYDVVKGADKNRYYKKGGEVGLEKLVIKNVDGDSYTINRYLGKHNFSHKEAGKNIEVSVGSHEESKIEALRDFLRSNNHEFYVTEMKRKGGNVKKKGKKKAKKYEEGANIETEKEEEKAEEKAEEKVEELKEQVADLKEENKELEKEKEEIKEEKKEEEKDGYIAEIYIKKGEKFEKGGNVGDIKNGTCIIVDGYRAIVTGIDKDNKTIHYRGYAIRRGFTGKHKY